MAYLLDSNVFIEAVKRYYRPSICPGFWDWLDRNAGSRQVFSIAFVVHAFQRMNVWIETRQYSVSAIPSFLSGADSFLVAQAIAYGHEVVTLEVPSPGSRKRIKIPDVCDGVGIPWLKPFDMLEREGLRLVLD